MSTKVLLDTSFLISLVDRGRPNHGVAARYYRMMLDEQMPMYFSAIVAAEFEIGMPISDLPLKNFRPIPFNIPHGREAGRLWKMLGPRDEGDLRHVVRDDVKLIAQACHESIPFILTEDGSTLYKYCERLRAAGTVPTRAVKLVDGFDAAALRADGQRGLDLPD
ncbi:MAG: PIN domain-containing protein [Rhodocyclaceae bacterium]|nr:PIN domain-containing protein [Rhodocyclaceae bacterium]MBX3668786.1 PIN domain-containing protein [Rhodocyclaceae bacterium]